MAYQFNPLYTGKGSAVELPDLKNTAESIRRSGEMQIKGAEMQLEKALKDKAEFQKMLAIDPVTALSTKNAQDQALMLERYNNKWAQKYVQAKGDLTFADQMEMQKDRMALQAWQNKTKADQEQYLQARDIIDKDVRGYYDKDSFRKAEQNYFNNGVLDRSILDVAPQDIKSLLSKDPNQSAYSESYKQPMKDAMGNVVGYQDASTEFKRSKTEAQQNILDKMQSEPVLKFVVRDFQMLPESEQYKWLKDYDRDGNGKIDPQEREYAYEHMNITDNPIVKWAMNNSDYLSASMGANPNIPKNQPSAKGGFGVNISVGGQPLKMTPGREHNGTLTYGNIPRSSLVDFGGQLMKNIPTEGAFKLKSANRTAMKGGGNVDGNLKYYDKESDTFIFQVSNNYSNPYVQNNELMEVPASKLSPDYDNIPVMANGKQTTVGAIKGQRPKTSGGNQTDIGL